MAIEILELKRVFEHGEIELEDPGVNMSKEGVLEFYSNQYPELTNSSVTGPKIVGDNQVFEFSTSVGTKG